MKTLGLYLLFILGWVILGAIGALYAYFFGSYPDPQSRIRLAVGIFLIAVVPGLLFAIGIYCETRKRMKNANSQIEE